MKTETKENIFTNFNDDDDSDKVRILDRYGLSNNNNKF